MKMPNNRKKGFNLVEVNLAVFLVAAGLLILFSLFPLGLRESQMSVTDTQEAMFADFYLGSVEAQSMATTGWDAWSRGDFIEIQGFERITKWPESRDPVPFPQGQSDLVLRYEVTVEDYDAKGDPALDAATIAKRRVILTVKGGRYGGKMNAEAKTYIADLVYMGM